MGESGPKATIKLQTAYDNSVVEFKRLRGAYQDRGAIYREQACSQVAQSPIELDTKGESTAGRVDGMRGTSLVPFLKFYREGTVNEGVFVVAYA